MIKINAKKNNIKLEGDSDTILEEISIACAVFLDAAAQHNEETYKFALKKLLNAIAAASHFTEDEYGFKPDIYVSDFNPFDAKFLKGDKRNG